MKSSVTISELDLGQQNAFVLVPVPQGARWARAQLRVQDVDMTWSAGVAAVKWCNLEGADPRPFATAVTVTASTPGTDRIAVSAVQHLVLTVDTAESGVKVAGVVVFDDQE